MTIVFPPQVVDKNLVITAVNFDKDSKAKYVNQINIKHLESLPGY
jgi:hypothetical protein